MNKKRIIYITVLITVITFIFGNAVFAKYYKGYSLSSTEVKIAKPIIDISKEDEDEKTVTETESANIVLNVSNFDDTGISRVSQNYYLQFYSDEFDISKVKINITKGKEKIRLNKSGNTKKIYMPADKEETHRFDIQIINASSESIKGTLKGRVISEQVQPT